MKHKVGTMVIITNNISLHGYDVGDKVEISKIEYGITSGRPYYVSNTENRRGINHWCFGDSECSSIITNMNKNIRVI
jgi:hypothetical protein